MNFGVSGVESAGGGCGGLHRGGMRWRDGHCMNAGVSLVECVGGGCGGLQRGGEGGAKGTVGTRG